MHSIPVRPPGERLYEATLSGLNLRKRKAKPLPVHVFNGSPTKSFLPTTAAQKITPLKDACIQTDTTDQMVAPKTLNTNEEGKENQVKTSKKRNFRSVSTEILETNDVQNSKNVKKYKRIKEKIKDSDSDKSFNNDIKKKIEHETSESQTSSESHLKELIIDEQDVLLLRGYIATHDTSIDLYRFDADDSYKTLVFYKINPLVRIERCARIAQMLKDRDVHITVHFARQLGLRSVNDSDENDEIGKRKKIRAAKKVALSRSTIDSESDVEKGKKNKKADKTVGEKSSKNRNSSTENDIDQENLNKPSKTVNKLIRETIDSDKEQSVHKKKVIPLLSSQSDNETFVLSKLKDQIKLKVNKTTQDQSNLDDIRKKPTVENKVSNDNQKNANEKSEQKKKKFDLGKRRIVVPKRSSVPPGREYSTLEDQAIVAWISAATQRERAVNGNRIWKELQEGYFKLTGQTRSWHSLRNRYLRYILPALGSLALPDAHARRLRAHATLGELKAHKKARRNSLLALPALRSAAARAPRPRLRSPTPKHIPETSSSESSESEPPKRRLRSSSVHTNQTTNKLSPYKIRPRPSLSLNNNKTKSPIKITQSPNKSNSLLSSNKATNHKRSPSKARQSRSPRSSPTYSELTRRFALRSRSTPLDSPTPAASHHKRRLYNPQRPASSNSSPMT